MTITPTPAPAMTDLVRDVPDWIECFMEYTDKVLAPENYRRWTAYSVLAGVIERRCWSYVSGRTCFPNLFIILVGRPGVGKTVSVDEAIEMWVACRHVRLAPSGMTKAAFIDHINDKFHEMSYNGHIQRYHPLCVASGEFGILLPDYNVDFLNLLNDFYDCRNSFTDRTRKDGLKIVDRPYVNLLAGTQPAYLNHILPQSAFGMGFTSRIIMVYSGQGVENKMFESDVKTDVLKKKLVHDLQLIQKVIGQFERTPEATEFMEDWYQNVKDSEAPDHSLLQNYNTRRPIHMQKLAMLSSISQRNDLTLQVEDYKRGMKLLLDAETQMPEIFKEMTHSEDEKDIKEIHRYVFSYCKRTGEEGIPVTKLRNFMTKRVPVNKMSFFLETLIQTGRLKLAGANIPGHECYKPFKVDQEQSSSRSYFGTTLQSLAHKGTE